MLYSFSEGYKHDKRVADESSYFKIFVHIGELCKSDCRKKGRLLAINWFIDAKAFRCSSSQTGALSHFRIGVCLNHFAEFITH